MIKQDITGKKEKEKRQNLIHLLTGVRVCIYISMLTQQNNNIQLFLSFFGPFVSVFFQNLTDLEA
jgi:hypothetical protein